MNEKFFQLEPEKRRKILDAGFSIFSQNSYQKSPVGDIAKEAGISKSLLFHYFKNKEELYLFLWDRAAKITMKHLDAYDCYSGNDLFEIMEKGLKAKMAIIRKYPHMAAFCFKAFYEKDKGISAAIEKSLHVFLSKRAYAVLNRLNPADFVEGLDLKMMYQQMLWVSEGYLWEKMQQGNFNADEMERESQKMLAFWKSIYLRKDHRNECDSNRPSDETIREQPRD